MTSLSTGVSSWRGFQALQQPKWPDSKARDDAIQQISRLPALVFAGETRSLKNELAEASLGRAFVLQAGDCAEDFARCHGPSIHDLLKVILQMSIVLTYAGERRVVKVGRIAGQYAKPRSSDTELVDGVELPSYRGDMINDPAPNLQARTPDPSRMLEAYFRATATLNLIRAFTQGGYAALDLVHSWSEASYSTLTSNRKYEELVRGIKKAISFMASIGIEQSSPQLDRVNFYISHEALLLEYEEALVRMDTTTGDLYSTSANMLWIGDRTRQLNGAHVEFLRQVRNPIGVKVGPTYDLDELRRVIEKLNPNNEPGRLTLITRLGADKVEAKLPTLIQSLVKEGFHLLWLCDPMHGNTFRSRLGHKTRQCDDILREFSTFWQAHRQEGTIAGGIHLELTGDPVTECVGGGRQLVEADLSRNYQSNCDPRLNAEQAVELAFQIADIIKR